MGEEERANPYSGGTPQEIQPFKKGTLHSIINLGVYLRPGGWIRAVGGFAGGGWISDSRLALLPGGWICFVCAFARGPSGGDWACLVGAPAGGGGNRAPLATRIGGVDPARRWTFHGG